MIPVPILAGLLLLIGNGAAGQPVPDPPPMPGMPMPMPMPGQAFPGESASTQPGPSRPMDQKVIDDAITRGVEYLRRVQNPTGTWGEGNGKDVGAAGKWMVGYTCLAGLALVECGVPTSDRGLQAALRVVRLAYPQLDSTYEVGLAILFLDRMGDPKDKGMIQGLAVRLIAGQTGTGGWSYKVPKVTGAVHGQILTALRRISPPPPPAVPTFRDRPSALGLCIKMSDDIRPKPPEKPALDPAQEEQLKARTLADLPTGLRRLPVFMDHDQLALADPEKKTSSPVDGTTDNSNTHFATLALWAARRHDVPTERSFSLLFRRFRTSQSAGGGWGYHYVKGGAGGTPAMTCIALLGVAIGHALQLEEGDGPRPEHDPMILKAFKMLSARVGAPTGRVNTQKTPKDAGGLYYLWTLERIAVLYDVQSLDKKDWYQWGAEILVGHQQTDGSWKDGGTHVDPPVLSTSLALLFLKRANLTPDLSKRLLVDPTALTASVTRPSEPKTPAPAGKAPPEPAFPFPIPVFPGPSESGPVTEPTGAAPTEVASPPPPTVTPTTAPAADTQTATSTSAEEESGNLPLILGGVALLLAAAGGGAFFVVRSKAAAAKPKGKGKKSKARKVKQRGADDGEDEGDED